MKNLTAKKNQELGRKQPSLNPNKNLLREQAPEILLAPALPVKMLFTNSDFQKTSKFNEINAWLSYFFDKKNYLPSFLKIIKPESKNIILSHVQFIEHPCQTSLEIIADFKETLTKTTGNIKLDYSIDLKTRQIKQNGLTIDFEDIKNSGMGSALVKKIMAFEQSISHITSCHFTAQDIGKYTWRHLEYNLTTLSSDGVFLQLKKICDWHGISLDSKEQNKLQTPADYVNWTHNQTTEFKKTASEIKRLLRDEFSFSKIQLQSLLKQPGLLALLTTDQYSVFWNQEVKKELVS